MSTAKAAMTNDFSIERTKQRLRENLQEREYKMDEYRKTLKLLTYFGRLPKTT